MKNDKLYDGITGIRENIVERAENHKFKKKTMTWQKWTAIAAAFVVVIGVGTFGLRYWFEGSLLPGAGSGNGGNAGVTYMSYAGPVFPLTTLEGTEGLTAERNIDFDFSPYKDYMDSYGDANSRTEYSCYDTESIITDSYTLTNTTGEDMTVTAVYPFAGSLNSGEQFVPTLTADGVALDTTLHIGPYSGGFEGAWGADGPENLGTLNLDQLDSWEGYKILLEAGYMDSAFDALPVLDQPVTVYALTEAAAPADSNASNPTLAVSFSLDYSKTSVLSYGFHGGNFDREAGTMRQSFSVAEPGEYNYGKTYYLILVGDDIEDYTIQGYQDGGCDEGEEIDGVTAKVARYETTLGEILGKTLDSYLDGSYHIQYGEGEKNIAASLSREEYLGLAAELLETYGRLSDTPAERYDTGWLEDIFSETAVMQRVIYLRFEITVPASESMSVTASMIKDASIDFIGSKKYRNGYDMVTQLGSTLIFTRQTASISNMGDIEIIDQNFGFDLANGATKVELDLNEEHYWLEVRKLPTEKMP
ncbi:MAG: hypothetical protein PHE09_09725 [Oscillospiraceae bacterium]|nr:hypothetical protein [Oscillospiraceae bacterium]